MARCEHCPLGIAIDALNNYADDFEDAAVIDPNSLGNGMQTRAQTYKKLFAQVACNVNCQYDPYAGQGGLQVEVAADEDEGFAVPNEDSIILDLLSQAQNAAAGEEVETPATEDSGEETSDDSETEPEIHIDTGFLDLDNPEDISEALDESENIDEDESEDEDEEQGPTAISMEQFLADLQNQGVDPRTIQACLEPFQIAIQLATAAQTQMGPRYLDPGGYLQSEQSRAAGKKVTQKVNFGFQPSAD